MVAWIERGPPCELTSTSPCQTPPSGSVEQTLGDLVEHGPERLATVEPATGNRLGAEELAPRLVGVDVLARDRREDRRDPGRVHELAELVETDRVVGRGFGARGDCGVFVGHEGVVLGSAAAGHEPGDGGSGDGGRVQDGQHFGCGSVIGNFELLVERVDA